jgi:hypothetical protein
MLALAALVSLVALPSRAILYNVFVANESTPYPDFELEPQDFVRFVNQDPDSVHSFTSEASGYNLTLNSFTVSTSFRATSRDVVDFSCNLHPGHGTGHYRLKPPTDAATVTITLGANCELAPSSPTLYAGDNLTITNDGDTLRLFRVANTGAAINGSVNFLVSAGVAAGESVTFPTLDHYMFPSCFKEPSGSDCNRTFEFGCFETGEDPTLLEEDSMIVLLARDDTSEEEDTPDPVDLGNATGTTTGAGTTTGSGSTSTAAPGGPGSTPSDADEDECAKLCGKYQVDQCEPPNIICSETKLKEEEDSAETITLSTMVVMVVTATGFAEW